jgi:hypothetical protein
MLQIPPTKSTDAEDVVWGLQTADTLWRRGERIDALVWLRRAAQAAGDANDDDRALELARHAAELTEWMANSEENRPITSMPPAIPGSIQSPTISTKPEPNDLQVQIDVADLDGGAIELPIDGRSATSVLPAETVHAGMFDPWADPAAQASKAAAAANVPPKTSLPSTVDDTDDVDEEIVTSVRPANATSNPPASSGVASGTPGGGVPKPKLQNLASKPPPAPKMPPPLPPRARPPALPKPAPPAPSKAPPPLPLESKAPPAPSKPVAPPVVASPPPPVVASPPPVVASPPAPVVASEPTTRLDLDAVDAFSDLPDDARTAFAAAATIHSLAEGEEIGTFALAYVLSGSFDVAATVVDAPAVRLAAGAVLRARGTTEENVPMRLISASGRGEIATWSDASVEEAFRSIPWVEDDLRAAADRVQTLVGITIGPLGERLDVSIREQIVGRLSMRPLLPGEVVVKAGDPVPLLLVGIGELELVTGDKVGSTVSSGDFLFPTEVLGAGAAPATARAGVGGAVVLFGDRGIAQELLVTCPPLLEVFAGM